MTGSLLECDSRQKLELWKRVPDVEPLDEQMRFLLAW